MTSGFGRMLGAELMDKAYLQALETTWCWDTCWPPQRSQWSMENRAWGNCFVTALNIQALFGGHIIAGDAYEPGKEEPIAHFRNMVPSAKGHPSITDLTWQQFALGTRFEQVTDPAEFERRWTEAYVDDTSRPHREKLFAEEIEAKTGLKAPEMPASERMRLNATAFAPAPKIGFPFDLRPIYR